MSQPPTAVFRITADIPLAARIVAAGAVALNPRGEIYTEENVGEPLSMRDLMTELRAGGDSRWRVGFWDDLTSTFCFFS